MPLYTYECESCLNRVEDYRKIDERHSSPECECGSKTKLVITPTNIAPDFQPYKAVAGDQRWIKSRDEHKKFLKENNLVEVGTDTSILPKE